MPDPAPERARLKSTQRLAGYKRLSPPLPENSIYFLPIWMQNIHQSSLRWVYPKMKLGI